MPIDIIMSNLLLLAAIVIVAFVAGVAVGKEIRSFDDGAERLRAEPVPFDQDQYTDL